MVKPPFREKSGRREPTINTCRPKIGQIIGRSSRPRPGPRSSRPSSAADHPVSVPTPTSSRTPKTDNEIRCHHCPKAITSALSATRKNHQRPSEASPLTAEAQLTLGAEVCGRRQDKYAAPCAGSRFTWLAPSLCSPDHPHCAEIPTHQSQAGRLTRHGCLMHQGLEQDVVQIQAASTRRERQPKLKINVGVWNTKDRKNHQRPRSTTVPSGGRYCWKTRSASTHHIAHLVSRSRSLNHW